MSNLVFRCQREGFESAASGTLLGGFDGRDDRVLRVHAIGDRDEQVVVSAHEQMHHELQWSTGWGVTAAMAGLLADAGIRTETLTAIASALNGGARDVHETFATTISCGIFGVESGRKLLADNKPYLDYLESGLALGGAGEWPWQFCESASQMLLRSLMQPVEILSLVEAGFGRMRLRDLPEVDARPDERLRRIVGSAGDWWVPVFMELMADHPDRGGDVGGPWSRVLPDDIEAMNAMKLWEEEVLIPTLQDVANARMATHGFAVLEPAAYLETVTALQESFLEHGPADWQVKVLTGPRRLEHEPLGAERESLQFHDGPFAIRLIEQDNIVEQAELFLGTELAEGPHVCSMYALPEVYRHQFQNMDWLPIDSPPLLTLLGQIQAGFDSPEVPIAMLHPDVTPGELSAMFTSLPVLTITTLSTTREPDFRDPILELDRSFIVVDLPLRLQVEQWANTGWTIRFRVIQLQSDRPLTLLTFAIDELPQCLFLAFRGEAGYGELAQLLDLYADCLHPDLELSQADSGQVNAVAVHLLNSWWTFRESGWT